jgi:hypothetical protein
VEYSFLVARLGRVADLFSPAESEGNGQAENLGSESMIVFMPKCAAALGF